MSSANTLDAMDPHAPDQTIELVAHPQTLKKIFEAGWAGKVGEYWGLVHGHPPDANPDADSAAPEPALLRPRAVYKGLERPLHTGHLVSGRDVYIYISNPTQTFRFKEHTSYGGMLETNPPPISSVFTTFVSLEPRLIDAVRETMRQEQLPRPLGGVLLYWEWTESSAEQSDLPMEYDSRYGTRIYPS